MNREMPASEETERAVLGAILDRHEMLYEAQAVLRPDDFLLESHAKIFSRMIELDADGKLVDMLTLVNAMSARNEVQSVGGAAYIASLTEGLPRRSSIANHIAILKEKSARRRLIHSLDAAVKSAWDNSLKTKQVLQQLEESLLGITASGTSEGPKFARDFTIDVYNEILNLRSGKGELIGLTTGLGSLDIETTGYRAGEFTIIGGWPGTGKSSLALQALAVNAKNGVPCAFFSLEMGKAECIKRIAAKESDVYYYKLHNPRKLHDERDMSRLQIAMEAIAEWPLAIDDAASLTIHEIVSRAKLLIRRKGVRLVVVDYLQIVDAEGRDERMKLTKISKALRQLAKAEQVAVVGLSQLSRPKDADVTTRPTKFHLKESGSLEADAHNIFLLWRGWSKQEKKLTGEDDIIIAKQRNGPTTSIPVEYSGTTLTYEERHA